MIMPRRAAGVLIAAIFLGVEIPLLADSAAAAAAELLAALQPLWEAIRPQDASELAQALLLALVIVSASAGRNAANRRLGGLALGTLLASGAWAAGELPAAGSAVLAAINSAELPVTEWVLQLVETADPK